jgi:Phospholipase B
MRLRCLAFAALAFFFATSVLATTPDPRLNGAYTFKDAGWTYIHLAGTPTQIGFAHGYLLADDIEDNVNVYRVEYSNLYKRDWSFFRDAARTILWPHIEPEYRAELQGIADGLHAHGSKLDLWDVIALNGSMELSEYWLPTLNKKEGTPNPPQAKAPGKCSAFIATGSATKDGKIVIAHSNWSSYAEGERWTVIFDIVPAKGYHLLMDGLPGVITSNDDFGVNSAGIMITETTLPMAAGFDTKGTPEFVRSRKAMQYANSIDDYAAIMRKGNNGGYANSWLVGDRKTGEIGYLELGLHHTPLEKKKDGYFVSSNFTANSLVLRDDTPGFDPAELSSSMNARRITADKFMKTHYGQLDTTLAEQYLSDHYDSFDKKEEVGKRSLCGHEELSAEGEPVWGNPPFAASGAVTGKVMDSDMAAKLTFIARAGHPCGGDFIAGPWFTAHPEFAWQKPILHDMKAGPWTAFRAGETATEEAKLNTSAAQ